MKKTQNSLSMISKYAVEAGLSGYSSKKLTPKSALLPIRGSRGMAPRYPTPVSCARRLAPPVEGLKICDSPLQDGQTNPDIFSTKPMTGMPTLRQKSISLRTSCNATSCGVVTRTAPSIPDSFKYCTIERCSSDVPGGVSTRR